MRCLAQACGHGNWDSNLRLFSPKSISFLWGGGGGGVVPCGMWDLSSLIRMELVPLHWKCGVLTARPPGESQAHFLNHLLG